MGAHQSIDKHDSEDGISAAAAAIIEKQKQKQSEMSCQNK